MRSFFNHRRTRHTAAMMLFVWLLALGTGIANACLVQPDHGLRDHAGLSQSGFASGNLAAGAAHHDADEHDVSPEDVSCLNFCLTEQNTLVKHHADGLADLAIVPVLFLTRLLVPVLDQASPPEAFGHPTGSEPPVYIRYLRLTI